MCAASAGLRSSPAARNAKSPVMTARSVSLCLRPVLNVNSGRRRPVDQGKGASYALGRED